LIIVPTVKGGKKLCHDGFYYTRDRPKILYKSGKIEWKCENTGTKSVPKCSGRAYSIGFQTPIHVVVNHNHLPVPERETVLLFIEKVKLRARTSKDSPMRLR
jgi:hypothetical protein